MLFRHNLSNLFVTWNLHGKYIGFEKSLTFLVLMVELMWKFQKQDYVIVVTNFQHRQTLYKMC
jgi:hypothetical protein